MVHSISIPMGRGRVPCAVQAALLAALAVAAVTGQAQPAAKATRPDPLDAMASVPSLSYESSFSQYRRLGEEKPVSWRDANDTVTRIGGWRFYAREAQQPDPAPAAKPVDAAPAAKPNEMGKPIPAGPVGHKAP